MSFKKKSLTKKRMSMQKTRHGLIARWILLGSVVVLFTIYFTTSVSTPLQQSRQAEVLGATTHASFGSEFFSFFQHLFLGFMHISNSSQFSNQSNMMMPSASITPTQNTQESLSQDQLLSMASNKYADGNLPLGDKKYVTDQPAKGYVYLCHAQVDPSGGGAEYKGPWISGSTWNIKQKISVEGSVFWQGMFGNSVSGDSRTLSGNDLPSHATGVFPIASTDPAYSYDKNPNSIKSQTFSDTLPTNPTYSDTPYCMGGEVGVMTTGVVLFNAFDAGLRDAAAYEVQDACQGHPQSSGEYHYHSLSSCISDISETSVIGYALDGFPITGPKVADAKYLTTDDLDECHGITSQINLDGKPVTMYHYVMTEDFPYSVSCFRGKPVSLQVITKSQGQDGQGSSTGNQIPSGQHPQPPQEAYTVCSGKTSGTSCSFTAPRGIVNGTCQTPPNSTSIVCVPSSPEQNQNTMPPQR